MTGTCVICGSIIRTVISLSAAVAPGAAETPEILNTLQAIRDLQEYEGLAHEMANHLFLAHPDKRKPMDDVGRIAARVYAMRWATSSEDKFRRVKTAYHTGLVESLRAPEATAASNGGSSSSSGTGSGSGS